jgi:hypothetical protein
MKQSLILNNSVAPGDEIFELCHFFHKGKRFIWSPIEDRLPPSTGGRAMIIYRVN